MEENVDDEKRNMKIYWRETAKLFSTENRSKCAHTKNAHKKNKKLVAN